MMWRRRVFGIALITALTLLVAFAIAVYVHHFGSAALHSSGYLHTSPVALRRPIWNARLFLVREDIYDRSVRRVPTTLFSASPSP